MSDRKKQLKTQYKERKIIGGVYRITNQKNGRFYLNKTADLQGSHNWFSGCCTTGICTHPRLAKEWNEYGKDSFAFEVLETWEKDAAQTDLEFENDLKELLEIWNEKLKQNNRY